MIRLKGGRREPRYFHLKDIAERKLQKYMKKKKSSKKKLSYCDTLIKNLMAIENKITSLLNDIKEDL